LELFGAFVEASWPTSGIFNGDIKIFNPVLEIVNHNNFILVENCSNPIT